MFRWGEGRSLGFKRLCRSEFMSRQTNKFFFFFSERVLKKWVMCLIYLLTVVFLCVIRSINIKEGYLLSYGKVRYRCAWKLEVCICGVD